MAEILRSAMVAEAAPVPVRADLPPAVSIRLDESWNNAVEPLRSEDASTRDAAALHQVSRSLSAAETCMSLLTQSRSGLMTLSLGHVLKAEMARATGLVQLLRVLKGDLLPEHVPVFCSTLLRRVAQSAEAECCLRGITLRVRSESGDPQVVGDEALLANVLLGALLTTFALLDEVPNPHVELIAQAGDGHDVELAVIQTQATASAGWMTHPRRTASAESTSDIFGPVTLAVGERAAQAWGGRFAVNETRSSTRVSLFLPASDASASAAS